MQTQEEYENLQFVALERSVSAERRRTPQLTPWHAGGTAGGTFRVRRGGAGTDRVTKACPEASPLRDAGQPPKKLNCTYEMDAPGDCTFDAEASWDQILDSNASRDRTFDRQTPRDRTFDRQTPRGKIFETNGPLDRTFEVKEPLNKTLDRRALMDVTFETDGPLNSTLDGHTSALVSPLRAETGADGWLGARLSSPQPRRRPDIGRRQARMGRPRASAADLNATFDAVTAERVGDGDDQHSLAAGSRVTLNSTFDGEAVYFAPEQTRRRTTDATAAAAAGPEPLLNRTLDRETLQSRTAAQEALLSEKSLAEDSADAVPAAARTPDVEPRRRHRHGSAHSATRQVTPPPVRPVAAGGVAEVTARLFCYLFDYSVILFAL